MAPPRKQHEIVDASFVIGAEAANIINVGVQLFSAGGAELQARGSVDWYLSSDPNGDALATAPSGGTAIGTDGLLLEYIAERAGRATSEVDGDIDVNITDTGTPTMYLVIVLPNGELRVSAAITFA